MSASIWQLEPWVFQGPGGIGWSRLPSPDPIATVTPGQTGPLWIIGGNPPQIGPQWPTMPPILNIHPPPPEPNMLVQVDNYGLYHLVPQRPPLGTMPEIQPNDRNPVTGAPIRNPELPPDNPLPPGQVGIEANGQHPITGAPIRSRGPSPMSLGAAAASYPWRHQEREETAPLPPLGAVPTVQGQVASPQPNAIPMPQVVPPAAQSVRVPRGRRS
jgi:hypothetical protein